MRQLLAKAIEYLQKMGTRLRLYQLCIATAVVYFQRFYVVFSLKKYDIFKMAAAALFLAAKVEETPKKLRDVVQVAWEGDPRRKPEELKAGLQDASLEFVALKDKLLDYERDLLRVLAFNLAVDHPYKYVLQAVKEVAPGSKELAQTAWTFVNDSLKTTLCLQYKPQVVACAVLDLTSKLRQMKLQGPPERAKWWYEEAPYCARPDQVEDIQDQLLSLYEKAKSESASLGERINDPGLSSKMLSSGGGGGGVGAPGGQQEMDEATGGVKRERGDEGDDGANNAEHPVKRERPPPPPPGRPVPPHPLPPAPFAGAGAQPPPPSTAPPSWRATWSPPRPPPPWPPSWSPPSSATSSAECYVCTRGAAPASAGPSTTGRRLPARSSAAAFFPRWCLPHAGLSRASCIHLPPSHPTLPLFRLLRIMVPRPTTPVVELRLRARQLTLLCFFHRLAGHQEVSPEAAALVSSRKSGPAKKTKPIPFCGGFLSGCASMDLDAAFDALLADANEDAEKKRKEKKREKKEKKKREKERLEEQEGTKKREREPGACVSVC